MHSYDNINEPETFRFLYNYKSAILSIHYFTVEARKINCEDFLTVKNYIMTQLIGLNNVNKISKVYLKRNAKKVKDGKCKRKLIYDSTYRTVKKFYNYRLLKIISGE